MRVIRKVETALWEQVAQRCTYATFFHTPIWQALTLVTFPHYRDLSFAAVLPSGVQVVFPLISVRHLGPLHDLHSSAMQCYGGPIADGPITPDELEQIYRVATGAPTLRLHDTGNPLSTLRPPGYAGIPDYTHILKLAHDFATTFAGFSKTHQQHYQRALRKGVTIRLAKTLDDYQKYYTIYQDSLRRWEATGKPLAGWAEPWERFAHGFSFAERYPEQLKLWLAEIDGTIVSGAWVFYWNRHAVYWHGATLESHFAAYPNIVVHTEVIRDAIANGYQLYDFNPSGGLSGVSEFKRRFGAEQHPIIRWMYGDGKFRLVRTAKAHMQMALRGGSA